MGEFEVAMGGGVWVATRVQHHLDLRECGPVPLQNQHRKEQIGLLGVNFVGKLHARVKTHPLDAQHCVDEIAT